MLQSPIMVASLTKLFDKQIIVNRKLAAFAKCDKTQALIGMGSNQILRKEVG